MLLFSLKGPSRIRSVNDELYHVTWIFPTTLTLCPLQQSANVVERLYDTIYFLTYVNDFDEMLTTTKIFLI